MKDTSQSFLINLRGNYFFASDAITNEFASAYYRGRFLTDDLKNSVTNNLDAQNSLAGEINWDVALTFHPDTNNRKVEAYLAYRNRAHVDSRFSKDFFQLFFHGNKMYAGKTADLVDFFFQQYSYRQIAFGISNQFDISEKSKLTVGADIAINQGIKFLKVNGKAATLYTDPDGEFIDADLHATIFTDDSAGQHPSKLDGTGYSGDFYLEYETEKSLLAFSVENFGSIHWNKWSTVVSLDSTFHFDGIDIRDLFEIGDSIKVKTSLDSTFYQNFARNRSEQRITTQLPMKISGSYTLLIPECRLNVTIGIEVLLNTYSTMRYFGGLNYKINRSNEIGFVIATGGYTTFHCGPNFIHSFPWHLKLQIGSNYLYPMLSYKTGKSQGAYLSLSKSF
ncbi:hypothetical protein BH11BAC1_BH11BAC1_23310 [soil metagenome]